jgi:16S rRNA (cytosine967-C5)-methyltransferase
MKPSSLIGDIVEAHAGILRQSVPVDNFLRDFFRTRRYLGSHDRKSISEAVFGMVRNYRKLDEILSRLLHSSGSASLPLYAIYQIRIAGADPRTVLLNLQELWTMYLPQTDLHAFIERITSDESSHFSNATARIGVEFSFPESICREWIERFGEEATERLCRALNTPAPTTVRVNTLKTTLEDCQAMFLREGIMTTKTTYSSVGLILDRKMNSGSLHAFHQGWFEMQDEASQLVSLLLGVQPGSTYVDACAGGGGKTLHIGAMMMGKGDLIAIDVDERRLTRAIERSRRAGLTNVRALKVTRLNATIGSLPNTTDGVLIDAPCTGLGTCRRNPGLKISFTKEFLSRVTTIQKNLLHSYSTLVRPGGRLVYSTCSLLQEENEKQVEDFLLAHPAFTLMDASDILPGLKEEPLWSGPYMMLLPHQTTTDGFFAAVMHRL